MRFLRVSSEIFIIFFILILSSGLFAQGTLEDYERAENFRSMVNGLVYNSEVQPNWIDNSNRLWYLNNTREGKKFVLIDAENRTRTPASSRTATVLRLPECHRPGPRSRRVFRRRARPSASSTLTAHRVPLGGHLTTSGLPPALLTEASWLFSAALRR